jgi:hypothetical protein
VKMADIKVMHQSSVDGVADMILLSQLHESSLLHNLRIRYFQDLIYVSFLLSYFLDESELIGASFFPFLFHPLRLTLATFWWR